jgi:uncharacterized protein YkwD
MMPAMRRIMSLVAGALAVVGFGGVLTACDPAPPDCTQVISQYADVPAVNLTVDNAEKAVFCLTNQQRQANGVSPAYVRRAKLDTAARKHADAAVAQKWWVNGADPHVNPIGNTTPSSRVRAEGYCPSGSWRIHENVFWGWGSPTGPTPRAAVTWWMGSTGHRANILDSGLRDIGVGVAKGAPEPGTFPNAAVFVQDFAVCT